MSHDQPDVPDYVESVLEDQSPEVLREVARRAHEIADAKVVQEIEGDDGGDEELDEFDEDFDRDDLDRDEAPAGATLTTKTIKGNSYYYWQWRDGDKIRSEYIRPVNPDE